MRACAICKRLRLRLLCLVRAGDSVSCGWCLCRCLAVCCFYATLPRNLMTYQQSRNKPQMPTPAASNPNRLEPKQLTTGSGSWHGLHEGLHPAPLAQHQVQRRVDVVLRERAPVLEHFPLKIKRCLFGGMPTLLWILALRSYTVKLFAVSSVMVLPVRSFTKICTPTSPYFCQAWPRSRRCRLSQKPNFWFALAF